MVLVMAAWKDYRKAAVKAASMVERMVFQMVENLAARMEASKAEM